MTCHNCQSQCKCFGRHRNGLQRFRCNQCQKTYTEDHQRPLDDMRVTPAMEAGIADHPWTVAEIIAA